MKARRLELVDKEAWIVGRVRGARVLHVGCTDWPLTAKRIAERNLLHAKLCDACEVCVGVDLDREGIEVLREQLPGSEFHVWNAEALADNQQIAARSWDYIVAGDVVEHMNNPGLFFTAAARLLANGGKLIVTVPSAFSARRFFWLILTGNEQVHADHTGYFSESTLLRIAERNRLRLTGLWGFQWRNPTLWNAFSNLLALPFLWLTAARCADELAVEFESKGDWKT